MPLTPSQIEVLARFDGWVKGIGGLWRKPEGLNNTRTIDDTAMEAHVTSPGTLIEMRLKIGKIGQVSKNAALWSKYFRLGEMILNKEYTAAAIKTSELIEKLEA